MSLPESLLENIATQLRNETGTAIHLRPGAPVGGGDINEAWHLHSDDADYFLKLNSAHLAPMFVAEAYALQVIGKAKCIRCPKVLANGIHRDYSWLVLEHLELSSSGSGIELGQQLAQLHKLTHREFGWPTTNFIGRTPQANNTNTNWCAFWLENRLLPQLKMAAANGFEKELSAIQNEVIQVTQDLLENHKPPASLLHGDLWSGNKAWLRSGEPVVFDPASYYGDRETDLAMTELFGGFGADFYRSYNEVWPLETGYKQRKDVYNLYHMLNHLNLFGGGYLASCLSLAKKISAHASR